MLTVKHVEKSGHESVTTAESVSFDPAAGENNEYPRGQLLAFGTPRPITGVFDQYSSGTVYVMNSTGATVAIYRLDV